MTRRLKSDLKQTGGGIRQRLISFVAPALNSSGRLGLCWPAVGAPHSHSCCAPAAPASHLPHQASVPPCTASLPSAFVLYLTIIIPYILLTSG